MGLLALLTDTLGYPATRLVVGHVDHGIRRDSGDDEAVVRQVAEARGIEVHVRRVDAVGLAKRARMSVEAAARQLRYEALHEMAENAGCRWILTAHTMDDSAETVLMRMRTGAPWYEWTGIPEKRGQVLRPLLPVSREDLRAWVQQAELPYREDETNSDVRFQRNRLRANVSACPEFWNRKQIERLWTAGRDLERALSLWRKLVYGLPVVVKASLNRGTVGLAIDEIFRYFNNLTFLPVEVMWGYLTYQQDARLPSKLRRQITTFLHGNSPEARFELPLGISLLRRGRVAWLHREMAAPVSKKVSLGLCRVLLRDSVLTVGSGPGEDGCSAFLRRDLMDRALTLRTWQAGDRIQPVKRPVKKISDLLNEMKLDPAERARILVLADDAGPLWIVGGVVDARAAADSAQGDGIWVSWKEGKSIGAVNDV